MELVSLQNLAKTFSTVLIKKSEKLLVRDVDEESPNHFVAYVDDGDQSFDVRIFLNQKKEVTESDCDCGNNATYCAHKIALLLSLASKKSSQLVKVVRKRKLTEAEIVLDELPTDEIKLWISNLLKKNKDLELLFLNEFKEQKASFSVFEVQDLIKTTIKSAIKNRKNIDAAQLKKTLDLLESLLTPVMKNIVLEVSKPESFHLLEIIMAELIHFEENVYVNSVKINRFIQKLNGQYLNALFHVKDADLWKLQCKAIFDTFLSSSKNTLHLYHIEFIKTFYDKIPTDRDKKMFYLEQWIAYLQYSNQKKHAQFPDINTIIIDICLELNVFQNYYAEFKPILYQNEYNLHLIKALHSIKKYDIVAIYAKNQIKLNSNNKYNAPYYTVLKSMYKEQGKDHELMEIALESILADFDFDTYLFVKTKFPLKFEAFKKNVYKYAYSAFNINSVVAELLFMRIFIIEKDQQAVLKYMTEVRNLSVFNALFKELSAINQTFFLYLICRAEYIYYDRNKSEVNNSIALVKQYYTQEEIDRAIKQMKSKPNSLILKAFMNPTQ